MKYNEKVNGKKTFSHSANILNSSKTLSENYFREQNPTSIATGGSPVTDFSKIYAKPVTSV